MDTLFNTVLANTSETTTLLSSLITMAAALLFGGVIAYTYKKTQNETMHQRSFAITLFMLPIILSVIILFYRENLRK